MGNWHANCFIYLIGDSRMFIINQIAGEFSCVKYSKVLHLSN